ncbi:hypothetical protein N7474_009728 [Penicillium riverlandense]|uniref:uncharacterized protein n=1 Tax=Penicillium riverlandense TaxID=1903569 RepID=UPI0025483AB0|nr:uncharacterized protein N7474_009728 [Penicillium riverlandense]KAJ5808459.1 hypothetical protein N7474_009728 [Penicillium riverlandense]
MSETEQENFGKNHMAIVLGIGLGVVLLIIICLLWVFMLVLTIYSSNSPTINRLTIFVNRRDRQAFLRHRKDPSERLRSLDAVSPTSTLEQWWSATKGKLGLSEAVDGQFVW